MTAVLRLAVPLALLALIWQVADGPGAARRLGAADPRWLALSLAAVLAQTLLSAQRWRLVARVLGLDLPLRHAVTEYFVAQMVNQTLPGGVPGDAARALRSRGPAGLRVAAQAVVVERLLGQGALVVLMIAALALSLSAGRIDWPDWVPVALAMAILVATVVIRTLPRWTDPLRLLADRQVWPTQAVLGVTIVALNLAGFAAAARATGTTLPVEAAVTLIPLILTAMLVPLTIAGWGWREGAAAALFPLAGASPAAGLAASAAFGAVILLAALPGVVWLRPHTAA